MKIILFLILAISFFKLNAIDLGDIGDSIKKDLGGIVDELKNELEETDAKNKEGINNNNSNLERMDCIFKGKHLEKNVRVLGKARCDELQAEWKKEELEKEKFAKQKIQENEQQALEKEKREEKKRETAAKNANAKNAKIEQIKNSRKDKTGKWGFNFQMNHPEAEKVCNQGNIAPLNFNCNINGKQIVLKFSKLLDDNRPYDEAYINRISLSMGLYTKNSFNKTYEKLSSKYKLLYKPSGEDQENYKKGFMPLNYYFKNSSNEDAPKYIGLEVLPVNKKNSFMYVHYLDKDYFVNNIQKNKEKKNEVLDDL